MKPPRVAMKIVTVFAIAMLALGIACAKKTNTNVPAPPQTAQYKAAVSMNDFASTLTTIQQMEQSAHASGFIDAATHASIEQYIKASAVQAQAAEQSIEQNDLTTAQSKLALAIGQLQALQTNGIPAIKDPTSQNDLKLAVTGAIGIITAWQATLGTPTSEFEPYNDLRPSYASA